MTRAASRRGLAVKKGQPMTANTLTDPYDAAAEAAGRDFAPAWRPAPGEALVGALLPPRPGVDRVRAAAGRHAQDARRHRVSRLAPCTPSSRRRSGAPGRPPVRSSRSVTSANARSEGRLLDSTTTTGSGSPAAKAGSCHWDVPEERAGLPGGRRRLPSKMLAGWVPALRSRPSRVRRRSRSSGNSSSLAGSLK